MARMLPAFVADTVRSGAERRLFERFRTELGSSWTVLHSLGLGVHPGKRWAEIDFVIVGPSGIFCVEVKGGRVSRRDGVWWFTDKYGRENSKTEGPFDQAGSAAGALQGFLRDQSRRAGERRILQVGWGVMTPDVAFKMNAPEVVPGVLFDLRDAGASLTAYIEKLADYWTQRLAPRALQLDEADIDKVIRLLRPDFDLRPSIGVQLYETRQRLIRCTEEQFAALDGLSVNDRVLVRGGAGTGKTVLALEEARRCSREGAAVLLTCFNAELGSYLAATARDMPGVTVVHLHGLMRRLVSDAGFESRLPAVHDSTVSEVLLPDLALEALLSTDEPLCYDVVVVDEAQDLLRERYLDVLDVLLVDGLMGGRWRFFLDPKQNLFDALTDKGLGRLDASTPVQFRLSVNCRNTAQIATMASILSRLHLEETLRIDGLEVDVTHCRDGSDVRRRVSRSISRLLSSGIKSSEIVVLSPVRRHRSVLREGLDRVPSPLLERGAHGNGIRYRTIHSFKGLESDVVVLVDIESLDRTDAQRALYVGASRARTLLQVFLPDHLRPQYDESIRRFGRSLRPRRGERP